MIKSIQVRGAKVHNLKNIDVSIPRDKFVVFTGLSGSGKSSLAFDTIFAEGQRRYVESLSSYARQFLGQMDKPDVESIDGLSPSISKTKRPLPITWVTVVRLRRYDYLRLLFARIGVPHCPECGKEIYSMSVDQIVDVTLTKISAPRLWLWRLSFEEERANTKSCLRICERTDISSRWTENIQFDEEICLERYKTHDIYAVIDRIIIKKISIED